MKAQASSSIKRHQSQFWLSLGASNINKYVKMLVFKKLTATDTRPRLLLTLLHDGWARGATVATKSRWSNPSGKVDTTWHHKYPPTDIDPSWPFQIRSNKGLEQLEDYSSLGRWAALMRGIAHPRIDSPWPFSGTPKWTNPLHKENPLFHRGFFRALARLPGGVTRVEGCADSLPRFPIPAQLDPTSGVKKNILPRPILDSRTAWTGMSHLPLKICSQD